MEIFTIPPREDRLVCLNKSITKRCSVQKQSKRKSKLLFLSTSGVRVLGDDHIRTFITLFFFVFCFFNAMFSFVVPLCVHFCVPAFVNSCSWSASSVVSFVYRFILKSSFLTSVLLPACAFLLIVCTSVCLLIGLLCV